MINAVTNSDVEDKKMELSKFVGEKIREYRKKNNMTQKELGKKI